MKIADVLKSKNNQIVFKIEPDKTICEAMEIFTTHSIGSLVVEDKDGRIRGLLTEKDVLKHCSFLKGIVKGEKIADFMTPAEKLFTVNEQDSIDHAMKLMTENRFKHLPVMDRDKLIGMISIGDVVKSLMEKSQAETQRLQDYISGKYPEE